MPEKRIDGFTATPNHELRKIPKEVGLGSYAVFDTLLSYRNQKTGICNPSQETLAEVLGIDVQSVRRHIVKLKDAGYIFYDEKQKVAKGNHSRNYTFPTIEASGFWGTKKKKITGAEIEALNREHEKQLLMQPAPVDEDGWGGDCDF